MQYDFGQEIAKLSVSERIQLAEEIWDSVARENGSFDLSLERKQELEKRSRSFASHPSQGRSWDQIKADSK